MNPSTIARRYGRALFELAVEEGGFEEVGRQLANLRAAIEADPSLAQALKDRSASREQRQGMAVALAGAVKAGPMLANALKLMADRGRLAQLPSLEKVFAGLSDVRAGRVRAKVTSAVPMTDEAAGLLRAALGAATARDVVLERAVDPALLGGVVAQVGSQVFDGSIKNQLTQLQRQLKA